MRASIEMTLAAHAAVDAPATWVLSNHDITRPVTRYGRSDTSFSFAHKRVGTHADLALGTQRARAAFLLCAALPGSLYVYQGEELGLPEDEELPVEAIKDPMYFRSNGADPGRDGCRVPLPWAEPSDHNFGFSAGNDASSAAWLPQPPWWGRYAVATQLSDQHSMLSFYRQVLSLRRGDDDLAGAPLTWLHGYPSTCLALRRGRLVCLVNFAAEPVAPPAGDYLISSGQLGSDGVPKDTAAWFRAPKDIGGAGTSSRFQAKGD